MAYAFGFILSLCYDGSYSVAMPTRSPYVIKCAPSLEPQELTARIYRDTEVRLLEPWTHVGVVHTVYMRERHAIHATISINVYYVVLPRVNMRHLFDRMPASTRTIGYTDDPRNSCPRNIHLAIDMCLMKLRFPGIKLLEVYNHGGEETPQGEVEGVRDRVGGRS